MIPPADALLFRTALARFAPLTEADWAMLEPHLRVEAIQKHQYFAETGKQATTIAFVLTGSFRQYYLKDGDERTTYFYFEGHLMSAYFSCISQQPSLLTIEALTAGSYVVFPYTVLADLYERSPAWQKFGRLLNEYIAMGLEDRMVGLLTQSPEERYLALLGSNKKKIIERIPQHYIANYLGITPVSLSRIRARVMK
ncbi:Crp/Fnr family transcriptional regulator [Fibrella aquatilis]|uniref:Crp/Fnr family transcriptional regulator n=1 Tax=Fibrella aquatilis TaxID=2817059 RepID=A0A939G1W5_9BACT|nr:Crp/Fnr family transcriptional regulator [Fibrella aquatilis]MBO0930882.1 Crp/Fnr family transcriptional regulator [Fibrella aquatilis]